MEITSSSEMNACDEASNAKGAVWEILADAYREKADLLRSARETIGLGFDELQREKDRLKNENGGGEVSDEDLIEINAGGKIVAAARGVLTRLRGTELEALFGGRWENKILRDESGRVFLDVNPKALRSIVDHLHELGISSPDGDVSPPFVEEGNKIFLDHLISFFGLQSAAASGGWTFVGETPTATGDSPPTTKEKWQIIPFSEFPTDLKKAFEKERAQLERAKSKLEQEWRSFQQEKEFIKHFLAEDTDVGEIVHLNVSGVRMSVKRSTLGLCKDSVLAKQFDDPNWRNSDGNGSSEASVQDWSPEQVKEWVDGLPGVPDDVSAALMVESVNGIELLAMGRQDFKELGITRTGTLALLMNGINDLKSQQLKRGEVRIGHSAYCFGKIVDQLRLRALRRPDEPSLPPQPIREEEEMRFKKVVQYYFPGDASSFILSGCKFARAEAASQSSSGGFSFGGPAARPRTPSRRNKPTRRNAPANSNSGGFNFGSSAPAPRPAPPVASAGLGLGGLGTAAAAPAPRPAPPAAFSGGFAGFSPAATPRQDPPQGNSSTTR